LVQQNQHFILPECNNFRLILAVPDVGQVLVFCKEKILNSYEVIKGLVERNDNIKSNIPPLFIPLIRLQLMKMEDAFRPGFSVITWTSTKIPEYCEEVTNVLDYIEMFVKEVKDMKEARIDEVLDAIATTSLVHLPNVALIPSEFLDQNKKYMDQAGSFQIYYFYASGVYVLCCSKRN
jgi:dynein heavy chain